MVRMMSRSSRNSLDVMRARYPHRRSLLALGPQSSLDRLWQYAKVAQARLDMAQQRLVAVQIQSREGLVNRIACGTY